MDPSFELFDHTADVGIRVWADTLPGLLAPAGEGLYAIIGELVVEGEARARAFDLTGGDTPTLLRDYLAELLLLFEQEHLVVTSVNVSAFEENHLTAAAGLGMVDPQRSVYDHEVKAITYHELDIRAIPGGFSATIIVDI